MPDDAKTDNLAGYAPPAFDRVQAVLFAAQPGAPGELLLQVFVGGRLVELALDLSAGDRVQIIEAMAAVPERSSRSIGHDKTIRTPLARTD